MSSAFGAGERHHLTEPDPDRCERCGDESYGSQYCGPCDDQINDEQWGDVRE